MIRGASWNCRFAVKGIHWWINGWLLGRAVALMRWNSWQDNASSLLF
jgi:hypothetical protein